MSTDVTDRTLLGYQAIPELIRQTGVPVLFGLLGELNAAWVGEGLHAGAFRYVKTRHESAAVSAAVGFNRVTGHVGLVTVERGPGFANCVNALKAAAHDHIPLVLIVAESPASQPNIDRNYHALDQAGVCRALGVGFHSAPGGGDLVETFWTAFRAARWNGLPQVLSLGDGMPDARVTLPQAPPAAAPADPPDPSAVSAVVDALAAAERPLILAGQGAAHAECRAELEELAELAGARLACTLNVNRFFSGHPRDLGVCGHSSPTIVTDVISQTDLVLSVGASFNGYTTAKGSLFERALVAQVEIDIDRPFHASRPELGVLGDAKEAARALIAEWQRRDLPAKPLAGPELPRTEVVESVLGVPLSHDPDRGMDPRHVFAEFDRRLPADRIVVSDSGRWSGTLPTFLDARDGRSWIISRGYGSIGLGLGNAIGACIGAGDRHVVLFCGDGGFMMTAQELDALRLNDLDLTIVIIDDEQYGAELGHLDERQLPPTVAQQTMPDVHKLAEAFGGSATTIRTLEDLASLELSRHGIRIVDVRIDPYLNARAAL